MEKSKPMNDSAPIASFIPGYGETVRLIIRDSILEECAELQALNEASDYIEKWVGWKTPKDYIEKALKEGNLPPGGKRENFAMKTICLRDSIEKIGVIELYHGYPLEDLLCIGWLFIHPSKQGLGYAKEAAAYLIAEARAAGYRGIRLGVHLKNWPALRFWQKIGFDKIIKFIGDETHSAESNATVILEQQICCDR